MQAASIQRPGRSRPAVRRHVIDGRANVGRYWPWYWLQQGGDVAKFNVEQGLVVAEVQQLINDWAFELDVNNGLNISELITDNCSYAVGPTPRQGRAEVAAFYQQRLERLSAQPQGVPTQRHTLSNLRVKFVDTDNVSITFNLVYFTTAGMASGLNHADPAAIADVRMNCQRGYDGHWRISKFDSNQTFRRVPA
jgi:hypothetical protein